MSNNKLNTILKNLKNVNPNIEIELSNMIQNNEFSGMSDNLSKKVEELLEFIRNEIRNNKPTGEIVSHFENQDAGKVIVEFLEKSCKIYKTLAALRTEEITSIQIQNIFNFTFDNFILRFDPDASEKYQDFGFSNKEELTEIMIAFDLLVDNCVVKLFSLNAIKKFLAVQTGFDEGDCDIMAQLIDKNFVALKENLILNMVRSMNEN